MYSSNFAWSCHWEWYWPFSTQAKVVACTSQFSQRWLSRCFYEESSSLGSPDQKEQLLTCPIVVHLRRSMDVFMRKSMLQVYFMFVLNILLSICNLKLVKCLRDNSMFKLKHWIIFTRFIITLRRRIWGVDVFYTRKQAQLRSLF